MNPNLSPDYIHIKIGDSSGIWFDQIPVYLIKSFYDTADDIDDKKKRLTIATILKNDNYVQFIAFNHHVPSKFDKKTKEIKIERFQRRYRLKSRSLNLSQLESNIRNKRYNKINYRYNHMKFEIAHNKKIREDNGVEIDRNLFPRMIRFNDWTDVLTFEAIDTIGFMNFCMIAPVGSWNIL